MKPATLMILDDDKADLMLAKHVLAAEKLFNDIVCFSTPAKAMEFLRIDSADVLMVDMALGQSTGLDFLAKAKAAGLLAGKTLIVISGLKDPELVARADLLGVSVWIDKPLNLAKLHTVVLHVPELFMGVVRK